MMSNMKVDARLVTALVGIVAYFLGWSEAIEQQAVNEVLQLLGVGAALFGRVLPEGRE